MRRTISGALCLLASCAPGAVLAQAAGATGGDQPSAQNEVTEILVTANKRSENIDKVGQTITAISGANLAERGIRSLEDIAAAVPGLVYSPSATLTPIFTLRGIGFNESSLGVYPAVSVYVDQIPLPFPVMASHSAYDLERIEVLKGPQGTLFGENSTGGAINYIAAKPTDHFSAGLDIGYGRFNEIDASGFVSGPLTDNLKIRVAMTGHHLDDWQYSVSRPNDTNGHQNYIAGRVTLAWDPTDKLKFSLNLNAWNDTTQPQTEQLIAVRPANPAYLSTVYPNLVFVPPNARAANWAGTFLDPALGVTNPTTGASVPGTAQLDTVIPFGDRHFIQAGLRTDCELSDDLTLTSLTSFDHYEQRQAMDTSGMQYAQTLLPNVDGHIDSFNQELRIANSQHNPLRWMLGANYENSITDEYQLQRYEHTAYNPAFLYINASGVTNHQHIENYAVFGNTEWSATSQLTLKAGVRWTSSNNSASICSSTIPGGNVDLLFNYLGSLLGSVPFTPIVIAQAPCFQGYHSALI